MNTEIAYELAYAPMRAALESTYEGVAVITEYQNVMDDVTNLTSQQEVIMLENQPCRVSFKQITPSAQSNSADNINQTVKLFISPDITINAGSKVTVSQYGITTDYMCSGVPAVYPTHHEIILTLFDGWA